MLRSSCLLAILFLTACNLASGQPGPTSNGMRIQQAHFSKVNGTCIKTLHDSITLFVNLEIDDGCVISFDTSFTQVAVTILNLTLHGKSTIDVSAASVPFTIAAKAPTPRQVGNADTTMGTGGATGATGLAGRTGPQLLLDVYNVTASDGSLWVKTDGSAGTPGSPGGDGGKGSGPNTSGFKCSDGGAGGPGGDGGAGGPGGNMTKVIFSLGQNPHVPVGANRTPSFSPSSRPAAADIPSAIVVAGSPGAGGPGGAGGNGGPGGEGRKCHFPASDSNPGPDGIPGHAGATGAAGSTVL